MSDKYPEGLLYTEDHEWARIEGTTATIGITQFAVDQLGDVTQVDLPREGDTIKRGEVFGSIESVKAVSDLYAPLTGRILKTNTPLFESPQYVNEEPYDQGWLIQIEIADASETASLMESAAYEAFLRESAD